MVENRQLWLIYLTILSFKQCIILLLFYIFIFFVQGICNLSIIFVLWTWRTWSVCRQDLRQLTAASLYRRLKFMNGNMHALSSLSMRGLAACCLAWRCIIECWKYKLFNFLSTEIGLCHTNFFPKFRDDVLGCFDALMVFHWGILMCL